MRIKTVKTHLDNAIYRITPAAYLFIEEITIILFVAFMCMFFLAMIQHLSLGDSDEVIRQKQESFIPQKML